MKLTTFKSKEIQSKIAIGLEKVLSVQGFSYKKTYNQFVCNQLDYTYIFNLLQTAWSDHYSLDVRLYISQKIVEDCLEEILGTQSHRLTIGNEIGRIYSSPDGRQVVNGDLHILMIQDEDIEAAVETLGGYYNNIANPYFHKYNNLAAIDNIINNPPFEHCPAYVGGRFADRCMKGLIVARLVSNPLYEKLVLIYDEAIRQTMNEASIADYCKVRDYLMYNRIK